MNESIKIDQSSKPDTDLPPLPEINVDEPQTPSPQPARQVEPQARPRSTSRFGSRSVAKVEAASRKLSIVFLIGIVGYGAGIGVGLMLLTGIIDIQTIKSLLGKG